MEWSELEFFKSKQWKELKTIDGLPAPDVRLKAFELTPFENVKAVVLGQDPYPTKGHAMGLAFSVLPHIKPLPPSLRNILKEYARDTGYEMPKHGDLRAWASQGVLLTNTLLSVQEGKPLSHKGKGWEKLIHEALRTLSEQREGIVWLLWGSHAQQFEALIDKNKHLVLKAGHPSPLSVKKFMGCGHFKKTCEYLGVSKEFWRLQ